MHRRTLDAILSPFERRRSTLPDATVVDRHAGLEFGWQLNRLQGAQMDNTDRRLAALYISGRVSRDEYVALVRDLAHAEQREKDGS
jgi:hypothetical protein